jgi:hypothetical protein
VSSAQSNREYESEGFDLRWYNEVQLQEIERHKWIESEKAGRDLGQDAAFDWIQRHAESFRQIYGSVSGRPILGG